jgi:hypothetical protein
MVLAVMTAMAVLALAFALSTQGFRRGVDSGIAQKPRHAPPVQLEPLPGAVHPSQLEALGYLPTETDLILAIHVNDLLASPLAPRLLQEGIRARGLDLSLNHLAQLTGLGLRDIDHLVIGLQLDASLPLHVWFIGRTREPYDAAVLLHKLSAQRVAEVTKRAVYRFQPKAMPLSLSLFCPDDRTVIAALDPGHLKMVPEKPNQGLDQLRPALVQVIRERCQVAQEWLALDVQDWRPVLAWEGVKAYLKDLGDLLAGVRTAAAWVQFDQALTVNAAIHCRDEAAAGQWVRRLQGSAGAEAPAVGLEKTGLKVQQNDTWVSLQLRTDLAGLQRALSP